MRSPGVLRFFLAALLLVQGVPGLHSPSPGRAAGMACCRVGGHRCSGHVCHADAKAALHSGKAMTPPGACVLDVGGCQHSPTAVATSSSILYVAVRGSTVTAPRPCRVAAIPPTRDHARQAEPPLSPPPRG